MVVLAFICLGWIVVEASFVDFWSVGAIVDSYVFVVVDSVKAHIQVHFSKMVGLSHTVVQTSILAYGPGLQQRFGPTEGLVTVLFFIFLRTAHYSKVLILTHVLLLIVRMADAEFKYIYVHA